MSATARARVHVDLPADELRAFVRDPHAALPVITGFGDFVHHRDAPAAGRQEWDVIYHVGALQLGGRVEIDTSRHDGIDWRSLRGTRHTFSLTVTEDQGQIEGEDDGESQGGSVLSLEMRLSLSGLLMARIAERTGAGIMRRHLEAAAEQLRHHAEWCR
ncbi:hypothetical protein ACFQ0K_15535 [Nocardioides caeni]|uniref:SRPBCC family protein n=1 Tax=Nocardioides caeni TaxID=574700 RepID=A0A4S8N3H3_9ACTN|nr:hypothetical protein [Nocardioides caeni]THV09449.1 hypothetical protein E9934_16065 [Nocardioides caeni]